MLNAIKAVYSGGIYYSPSIANSLIKKSATEPGQDSGTAILTDREQIILAMLANGQSSKSSASNLGISPWTVDTYRRNIKKKPGLTTMSALIRFAIDSGLGNNEMDG